MKENELINNLSSPDYKSLLSGKINKSEKDNLLYAVNDLIRYRYPFKDHVRILDLLHFHLKKSYINKKPIELVNKVYFNQPLDIHSSLITLLGNPGTGKHSLINTFFFSHPVIKKEEYIQIPVIVIKSNGKTTFKFLAMEVCAYIDKLLGTNHCDELNNLSTDNLIYKLKLILAIYNVGMLVITDFERIGEGIHNDKHAFIKKLDTLGVSVILVGTPSIENMFSDNYGDVINFSSSTIYLKELDRNEEYNLFINDLISSYPLNTLTNLNDNALEEIYFKSKGNLFRLIKIFKEIVIACYLNEDFTFKNYDEVHSLLTKANIQIDGNNEELFFDLKRADYSLTPIQENSSLLNKMLLAAINLGRDEKISFKLIEETLKENYKINDFDILFPLFDSKYLDYLNHHES